MCILERGHRYELLFNYLPEIIVYILLTSNCLDSSSPDNSAGVVLIPLMIPLMYQSQGNASVVGQERETDRSLRLFQELNWILSHRECVQLGGALGGRRAFRDDFGA